MQKHGLGSDWESHGSKCGFDGIPQDVVDGIEMSDVAADVAAVAAFLAADTTDVLAADTTDVFSAAKAASGGSCPAIGHRSIVGQRSIVRPALNSKANVEW